MPSRSRPRVSNDNAYLEALFRTLKYRPGFPAEEFETLEQAREWVLQFVTWYNHEHRHSALKYVTPAQRHTGQPLWGHARGKGEKTAALVKRHSRLQFAGVSDTESGKGGQLLKS